MLCLAMFTLFRILPRSYPGNCTTVGESFESWYSKWRGTLADLDNLEVGRAGPHPTRAALTGAHPWLVCRCAC